MIPEILQKGGEGGTHEKKAKRLAQAHKPKRARKIYFWIVILNKRSLRSEEPVLS